MPAFKDLTGQTFGELTVIRRALITQGKKVKYVCKCDCGNETVVAASNLTNGHTVSCGHRRGILRGKQLLLPYGESAKRDLYRKYSDSAKRRNVEFSVSFDEFIHITSQSCVYCGREPFTVAKRAKSVGYYVHNGVDRVNNDLGYIEGNMVACCTVCNRAKGNMNIDDFIDWLNAVSSRSTEVLEWLRPQDRR